MKIEEILEHNKGIVDPLSYNFLSTKIVDSKIKFLLYFKLFWLNLTSQVHIF